MVSSHVCQHTFSSGQHKEAVELLNMPSKQDEINCSSTNPYVCRKGLCISPYMYPHTNTGSGLLRPEVCGAPNFSFIRVGRFTWYNFMVYKMLTTNLGHECFDVNKT